MTIPEEDQQDAFLIRMGVCPGSVDGKHDFVPAEPDVGIMRAGCSVCGEGA